MPTISIFLRSHNKACNTVIIGKMMADLINYMEKGLFRGQNETIH